MTEIKVVVVDGKKKAIEVKDGLVLVFCGHGPNDAAFWKKFEECGEVEFAAAEEVADFTPKPWSADFDGDAQPVQPIENNVNDKPENDVAAPEYKYSFDAAVNFLAHCKGEDFLELVKYAKKHNNTFFHCVKEVADVVNADDAYCSALIQLSRPLGAEVEHRAFQLFEVAEESELCEENFLDFWKSLQIISYFCG